MKPRFDHDCSACKLLCVDSHGDWYVCGESDRSILMRFGNEPGQYQSGGIAECAEMTPLELAAVARGLELTPEEQKRTLVHMYDRMLGRMDIKTFGFVMPDETEPAWRPTPPVEPTPEPCVECGAASEYVSPDILCAKCWHDWWDQDD